MGPRWGSDDEVDQAALDDDRIAPEFFAFEFLGDVGLLAGGGDHVFIAGVGGDLNAAAHLAAHLDGDFDRFVACEGFIELGPGLCCDGGGFADALPEFFGDVRREGSEESQESGDLISADGFGAAGIVNPDDHLCDSGVVGESLEVFGDLLDGFVEQAFERLVVLVSDFAAGFPAGVGVFVVEGLYGEAPDALEEAVDADDVSRIPGFAGFEGAHVHFVKPEGVGAVLMDDGVGVDDVSQRLGHFLDGFGELFTGLPVVGGVVAEFDVFVFDADAAGVAIGVALDHALVEEFEEGLRS